MAHIKQIAGPALTLSLAFAAALAVPVHVMTTINRQPAMNEAAIEAGYDAMAVKPGEERNGGIMVTTRRLFYTAATVDAYFVDQAKKQKLCKYEGITYQLFGRPLFSTTQSLSCAPVAPWPELPPKP